VIAAISSRNDEASASRAWLSLLSAFSPIDPTATAVELIDAAKPAKTETDVSKPRRYVKNDTRIQTRDVLTTVDIKGVPICDVENVSGRSLEPAENTTNIPESWTRPVKTPELGSKSDRTSPAER
jgi:hypothetical protein